MVGIGPDTDGVGVGGASLMEGGRAVGVSSLVGVVVVLASIIQPDNNQLIHYNEETMTTIYTVSLYDTTTYSLKQSHLNVLPIGYSDYSFILLDLEMDAFHITVNYYLSF